MKNKAAKQKSKKKGSDVFGCDLIEHLQNSGQDVPQVLKTCAEFIEKHGIVDGIYRLSGVTSNIQRLRQEFCSESCPDLTKEVYLQDIHCVGSLCKLYFRELPNPLLTYELYKKFTDAASLKGDDEKLLHIQSVIKELPVPHFRTLEFLTKHLAHLATLSPETNMHARNLALVWAPNLLRFKDIDVSTCNGDKAFQEVRVQQSVVEFILNHTEQIFNHGVLQTKPKEGQHLACGEKYATLPLSGQSGPMKLMSLEEAQARTLSPNHPARKERQRENSLPDASSANLYHTVIDISDSKKLSGKSKKWKSIFNLGKSVGDSKGKLSRNGSVFMRTHHSSEKAAMRPARSMDSLCSLPTDDDKAGNFSAAGGANGLFVPGMKSRTLGSDTLYDLSEQDQKWEFEKRNASGATGGCSPNVKRRVSPGALAPLQKALPEQLKVFKGDDLSGCEPTSPKNRRMLYSGSSHNSASRPSFPGSMFPLESSPRHQRKALNISEPFAVSVPLRVSAVISVNSTPCRASGKDKPTVAALKPCRDTTHSDLSDSSGGSGYRETTSGEGSFGSEISVLNKNSSIYRLEVEERQDETVEKRKEETAMKTFKEDLAGKEVVLPGVAEVASEKSSFPNPQDTPLVPKPDTVQSPGNQLDDEGTPQHKLTDTQLDKGPSPIGEKLWSDVNQELKIIEPEIGILEEEFQSVFCSTKNPCENVKPKLDARSKRRSSLPTYSLLYKGHTLMPSRSVITHFAATGKPSARKLPSKSDTLSSFHRSFDFIPSADIKDPVSLSPDAKDKTESKLPYYTETSLHIIPQCQDKKLLPGEIVKTDKVDDVVNKVPSEVKERIVREEVDGITHRLSVCLESHPVALEPSHLDNEEGSGGNYEELDMVEPWEDCSSSKQWVTSPLHSPTLKDLFGKLDMSPPCSVGFTANGGNTPPIPASCKQINRTHTVKSPQPFAANTLKTCIGQAVTIGTDQQLSPSETSMAKADAAQPDQENNYAAKPRNTTSFQRFHRQMSHEASHSEKCEGNYFPKHRPFSLNLDLGNRCIRDISNQQHYNSSEVSSTQRGTLSQVETKPYRRSMELEMFLMDHQAPVRRNSAPVSVTSVRTAFMIKTCQAKAVPVIPPKVQYSHIPHPRPDNVSDTSKGQEKERTKTGSIETETGPPLHRNRDFKEELENKEPAPRSQRQLKGVKSEETCETASILELPVLRRKRTSNVEAYADCLRPDRPNVIQRPSFRNRQRPQSLILFSPPFPIMDYPPLGDDGKFLLSPIKSPTDAPALDVFSNKMADNLRTPEGVILRNKMTIPKIGQRLETSTSCFYQPQRRSMIFDNRSHRQIE